MEAMKDRVNSLLNGIDNRDQLRFVLYSVHDFQIANMLRFLNLTNNFTYHEIPFAANIHYELYYNQSCVESVRDTSCFSVQISYNEKPLHLSTCYENNLKRNSTDLSTCTYDDFLAHLAKVGIKGDLKKVCSEKFDAKLNPVPALVLVDVDKLSFWDRLALMIEKKHEQ